MDNRRAFFKKSAGLAALATALAGSEVRAEGVNRHNLIRAVKRARIFDLSHLWDETSPIAGVNPPYDMTLDPNAVPGAANHASTRGTFGDNGQLSFAGEVQHWSGQHGAPNFDTIGHIGQDGLLFGGVDAAASTMRCRSMWRASSTAAMRRCRPPSTSPAKFSPSRRAIST